MGKNASIVLNIVLIIAVVPLYLMHFSDGKKGTESSSGTAKADSLQKEGGTSKGRKALSRKGGDLRVAYVNWDTLMNEYHYVEDMLSELEKEQIRMRKELQGKMQKLEKEYKKLKEESTYMTQSELKKAQRRMQRKQQNLKREQQGLQGKLARKRQKMLKKFFDNVNQYLDKYNEENDLDLILRYQRGGDLLYARNGFEITDTVLSGLNEKYEEEGADKKIPEVSDTGQSPLPQQQGPLSP